jgi:uncharacterized membrane protein
MRPGLALLSLFVLAACSPGEDSAPPAPPEPGEPATMLAGVDLGQPVRALGTEPFWSVELTGTEMVYSAPEPPEQRAPQPRPVLQGTTAAFESETADGTRLKVTLVATECSDGMSDRTFPLTAMVTIGERKLTGCAAGAAAIMSSGESSPVVEPAAG